MATTRKFLEEILTLSTQPLAGWLPGTRGSLEGSTNLAEDAHKLLLLQADQGVSSPAAAHTDLQNFLLEKLSSDPNIEIFRQEFLFCYFEERKTKVNSFSDLPLARHLLSTCRQQSSVSKRREVSWGGGHVIVMSTNK